MNYRVLKSLAVVGAAVVLLWMSACSEASTPAGSTTPLPAAGSPAVLTSAPSPSIASTSTGTTAAPEMVWEADGVIRSGEYSGVNRYGEFSVHWRSDDEYIYIGIAAPTSGWVALAFSPGARMRDSDMLLGFVKDGRTEMLDQYCTDNFGSHPPDAELGGTNDVTVFGGQEKDGITTLEFKRLLTTSDRYDLPVNPGLNKILWSYGSSDSPDQKHLVKGAGEINP